MHYGCVMKAFISLNDARGLKMGELLTRQPTFARELGSEPSLGHPWQLIFWHIACWYFAKSCRGDWKKCSSRAVSIARDNQGYATMRTFALCVSADRLLKARTIDGKTAAVAQTKFDRILLEWRSADVPDTMRAWFEPWLKEPITDRALAAIADSWLR